MTTTTLPRTLFIKCDAIKRGISHQDKGGVNPGKLFSQRFYSRTETFLIAALFTQKFLN